MVAVPSAPALAASAAARREDEAAAAAGTMASNMVRLPTVAPPYKLTALTPWSNASVKEDDNWVALDTLRKKSSNKIPDVPPMDAETASATDVNKRDGCSMGNAPASNRANNSTPPRFMVSPQSPSPTMSSYFVKRGSLSIKTCAAARMASVAMAAKFPMTGGKESKVTPAIPSVVSCTTTSGISSTVGRVGVVVDTTSQETQAGAVHGASK
mmetsp:Transcript_5377/g.9474  ORF Transcript_5377/g.9474 Transcript_5377/m.9474 type:complete len:212 (-) Transcript_5377:159-794(-)